MNTATATATATATTKIRWAFVTVGTTVLRNGNEQKVAEIVHPMGSSWKTIRFTDGTEADVRGSWCATVITA